jgi:hypothetical protein
MARALAKGSVAVGYVVMGDPDPDSPTSPMARTADVSTTDVIMNPPDKEQVRVWGLRYKIIVLAE